METKTSRAIVLYNRNYREDDKLVKLFTETSGKRMFFVKHASKSKLAPVIQPLTVATFLMKLNDPGLSYIEDYQESTTFKKINQDIFSLSYATYIMALADAAVSDNDYDPQLFAFLIKTLELMEEGLDYELLTNIFEIQILERFGVQLNFHDCSFCHRVGQPFDFSFTYSGLLCPEHYDKDPRRSHLNPNVPYLINLFQSLSFDELGKLSLKPKIKGEIRHFIDTIYDTYVGIQLKPKKFIDELTQWGSIFNDNQ